MKTVIKKVKGDWVEVLNNCRSTINKEEINKEPSEKFKKELLIAEHSPIRSIIFCWSWKGIASWIATHFCRHKWECFISTRRTDRYGIPRSKLTQDTLVDFSGEANVQALIDTMRKRLCSQAAKETREYAEDLKLAITEKDKDIGHVLVPNCIYRCGCPEMNKCGLINEFKDWCKEKEIEFDWFDIKARYNAYNMFFSRKGRRNEDRNS